MSTKQVRTTLDALIRKVDPDFDKNRKLTTEYQFTDRDFSADVSKRGAYTPEAP